MKILLLLALSVPAFAAWPNGYTYKRSITIDHTKVPNTDQSAFPVLICFNSATGSVCDGANSNTALAGLKTVANGGKVQNTVSATVPYTHTVCADCIITDTDGSTVLNFEIEQYNATTGEAIFWVNIGTLSHTVDYVLYIYYGNSSVTTDQENVHSTWNAAYQLVSHFQDGSTLQLVDSTTNAATGTNNGATATTGSSTVSRIGPSASIALSNHSIGTGYTASGLTNMTAEVWATIGNVGLAVQLIGANREVSPTNGFGFINESTQGLEFFIMNSGNLARKATLVTSTNNLPYHLVGTHTAGDNHVTLYVNGTSTGTDLETTATNPGNTSVPWQIGRDGNSSTPYYFAGSADETRISNVVRSTDWVKTEYNNMSSPNTFYTLGSEQTSSATIRHRVDQ